MFAGGFIEAHPTYPCSLDNNLYPGAGRNKIVEVDHVGVFQAYAPGAGGCADEVLAVGAMDVNVAIPAGPVMGLFAIEPEDAGEDEVLFLQWVGGFPDATGGFASDKLGA